MVCLNRNGINGRGRKSQLGWCSFSHLNAQLVPLWTQVQIPRTVLVIHVVMLYIDVSCPCPATCNWYMSSSINFKHWKKGVYSCKWSTGTTDNIVRAEQVVCQLVLVTHFQLPQTTLSGIGARMPNRLTASKAFARSSMEYCSPLWDGSPASHICGI